MGFADRHNNHTSPEIIRRNYSNFSDHSASRSPIRTRPASSYRPDLMSPTDIPHHDALHPGRVAVITGAADGIGLAAAREFANIGMKLALADIDEAKLATVCAELSKTVGEANLISERVDVSKLEDVQRLRERVLETWGEVSVLLNNAGVGPVGGSFKGLHNWRKVIDTNLWGVVNVQHAFVPFMLGQENQCLIINTGSKQGITNPPGNAAYNASKAAVRSLTESLSHELRTQAATKLTAHLFIPGWTHTGLTSSAEKPAGAWTAAQTVQYMLLHVRRGDFYIVCPDNETTEDHDRLRMAWGAGDIVEGRPALSRWHPEYKADFEEYLNNGLAEIHKERTWAKSSAMNSQVSLGVHDNQ